MIVTLRCRDCPSVERFAGPTLASIRNAARAKGWYISFGGSGNQRRDHRCPDCESPPAGTGPRRGRPPPLETA